MSDNDLEKNIQMYQDLAKKEPNVDINMLMMNALQKESEGLKDGRSYKWAYIISLGVPPFGLLFALKYFIHGDDRDRTAAYVCIGLTILSIIITLTFGKLVLSSSGTSMEQVQQIKIQDIQQLTQ